MKKYCKCNISLKKVLQYCKSCNKQYFANTLKGAKCFKLSNYLFSQLKVLHNIKMFYVDKKNLFQVIQIMTQEIRAKDTSFP